MKYKTMRTGFLVGLAVVGIVLIISVARLEQTRPVVTYERLTAPVSRVPVATSSDALNELRLALHNRDLSLIETMIEKGKALSVANHRRVTVVARYNTAVVVEIVEGSQAGKTVWVLPSFLIADTPETNVPMENLLSRG